MAKMEVTLNLKQKLVTVMNMPADARLNVVKSFSPAQYLRLKETTGTTALDKSGNARNGTYTATDIPAMLGQNTGPFGGLVPQFDPANGSAKVDVFGAGLAAAINMAEMSFIIAFRVNSAAIWTDATTRYVTLLRSGTTANQLLVQRTTTNNQLIVRRTANTVSKTHTLNTFSPTTWTVVGLDVSEAGGIQQLYINGVPTGANQTPDAWAGGALTLAQISPAVSTTWLGGLAEWAIFPAALGAEAHARLASSFFPGVIGYSSGADLQHILITGQSLSQGTNGGAALTTSAPYGDNYAMTSRPLSYWFEPLDEVYDLNYPNLESPASALGAELRSLAGHHVVVSRNGQDGQAYAALKKGTANYANGITQATRAYALAGSKHKMAGVSVIHGETDGANNVTAAAYAGYLVEWQADYTTDINAVSAHTGEIPLLVCQLSSQAATITNTLKPVSLGQYNACKANPTKLYLVGPKYQLTYADSDHLTNTSYRWLGEYHAKAWKSIIAGDGWEPLWPDSVSRDGAVITLAMHVPAAPMVFDTTIVAAVPNYGFEYADDTSSATISTVAIDGNNIVITLSATPTGANKKIRYAYTNQIGGVGPAGNLRDSDSTASVYGNTLYNWCVHFEEAT